MLNYKFTVSVSIRDHWSVRWHLNWTRVWDVIKLSYKVTRWGFNAIRSFNRCLFRTVNLVHWDYRASADFQPWWTFYAYNLELFVLIALYFLTKAVSFFKEAGLRFNSRIGLQTTFGELSENFWFLLCWISIEYLWGDAWWPSKLWGWIKKILLDLWVKWHSAGVSRFVANRSELRLMWAQMVSYQSIKNDIQILLQRLVPLSEQLIVELIIHQWLTKLLTVGAWYVGLGLLI